MSSSASQADLFKNEISRWLGCEDIFLFWKARVGLYTLLKAIDLSPGDEVIVPAYTCVVVPNAILYLGARPVYVDIEKSSYNMDASKVSRCITNNTKAIICQNTYGLSSGINEIVKLAKQCNIYTIEDCTHGFGGEYNGVKNGLTCDAAIYSTQWNKPFTTGIGGILVVQDEQLKRKTESISAGLLNPSRLETLQLKFLLVARSILLNDSTYWAVLKLYRLLSKFKFVVGSSSEEELISITMPSGYFKAMSNVQAREGVSKISTLQNVLDERKRVAHLYSEELQKMGKNFVDKRYFDNHSFLTYPLLVSDRKRFFELAVKARIRLGDWFLSPLHPVKNDLSPWMFDIDDFPVAKYCSDRVVNLPTTAVSTTKVLEFLKKNRDLIES